MKKILLSVFLVIALFTSASATVDEWNVTAPANGDSPSNIGTVVRTNNNATDRFLAYGQFQMKLSYNTAAQLTVGAGSVVCSNSAGTVRRMRINTASTTITWADIDTGTEAAGTTYYIYAVADTSALAATFLISTSATAPVGATYYKRLGSFYNDSSSNITLLTNDSNYSSAGKSYDSGWFAISVSSTYTKTHSLGTTKCITLVYFSTASDGSGICGISSYSEQAQNYGIISITALSPTSISLATSPTYVARFVDGSGNVRTDASGYCRIIMLALE